MSAKILILATKPSESERIARAAPVDAICISRTALQDSLCDIAPPEAPAALVISARILDGELRTRIRYLRRAGRLPHTAIYIDAPEHRLFAQAYAVRDCDFALLFNDNDLDGRLADLINNEALAVCEHLISRLDLKGVPARLLQLLAGDYSATRANTNQLARRIGVSRSALYKAVAIGRIPPIEEWQALFRLLPAIRVLREEGRAGDAAHFGGFCDAASLRRALKRRLSISTAEARECQGWRAIVERWLTRQQIRGTLGLPIETLGPRSKRVTAHR